MWPQTTWSYSRVKKLLLIGIGAGSQIYLELELAHKNYLGIRVGHFCSGKTLNYFHPEPFSNDNSLSGACLSTLSLVLPGEERHLQERQNGTRRKNVNRPHDFVTISVTCVHGIVIEFPVRSLIVH